ncbi:hypothetical protein DPMN_050939 [Dreissena polymorpha]|uniref:P2X purinoreceptor 7 intracellular domain-containing protein n=1 Tax=Dreissena polymorpha TaxID=45954 RepID=A0A9D4HMU5_DREPO|nr:hypothetical protein DPMN_050939 [Dreissena polymorpha]
MLDVLQKAVTNYPSLMFDIMRPAQRQPGGFHPGPGPVPDWCVCGRCREMPTEREKVCCERENCDSSLPIISYFFKSSRS